MAVLITTPITKTSVTSAELTTVVAVPYQPHLTSFATRLLIMREARKISPSSADLIYNPTLAMTAASAALVD